jgi:hypothetical protein
MADPYASFSKPAKSAADPYAAFSKPAPGPSMGGVQDWEPSQQPTDDPTVGERINRGVNWLGTRITKAGTGFAGATRGIADINRSVIDAVGLPQGVATVINAANPVTAVTQFLPTSRDYNKAIFQGVGVPEVDLPGRAGKVIDTGVETAISGLAGPGNALRNAVPAFVGGAASEVAGQLTEGTKYEPLARAGAGIVAGGATALGQNAFGNLWQGIKNLMPNIDDTAAKVIARNLIRDKTTGNALADAQKANPGSTLVENAGPNVRGALRGSTAAPGPARTIAQDAFDTRIEGTNTRTTNALDKSINPNSSLASTVDDLSELRRQAATPAYEAAGIPRRPESRITAIDEPPTWNTRQVDSPELQALLKDSPDLRRAVNTLRRFPDYKNVPANSMSMWDEAYKMLGGMEREAVRGGNDRKAMLIGDLRRDFQTALVDANPDYGRALKAYSGPSKLIDASERGKEWFTKNVDPTMVRREFETMSPGERESVLIGIRDWARTKIGNSDRGTAAERVWAGGNNRERLEAILGPDAFKKLQGVMESEKNLIRTQRDVGVGSRTTPMALEAADNALADTSVLTDLLRGHLLQAGGKFAGRAAERIGEGKTEAVNARIAEMLTSTDPAKVGLVQALAEQARLRELARRSGRFNALTYGGVTAPGVNALAGADR